MSFELDLACLPALLGKIMMSQDVRFRGSWKREQGLVFVLYQLPCKIAKFYLFSWEEKLVALLIATPTLMEKCANRKTKEQSIGA